MRDPRDLLLLVLLAAVPLILQRSVGDRPFVGPPRPESGDCAVAVEVAGVGVGCVAPADARAAAVSSGDRLELAHGRLRRGRMAPERLSAWSAPVDLNRATEAELASLDGIGPRLAARIREARPFSSVDELERVRGIGARRLERLRARLVTTGTPVRSDSTSE